MSQPMPDWALAVPSTPGVHPSGTEDTAFTRPFTQAQLLEIGRQFIEQFVAVVVKALAGAFIPGVGPAVDQLVAWADNILSGGFLSGVIFGGESTGSVFPMEFPGEFPTPPNPVAQFFAFIQSFTGTTGFDFAGGFNIDEILGNFINGKLLPQDILAQLSDLLALGDGIVAAFNNVPLIGPVLGGAVNAVWLVIRGLFGTGLQNSNDIVALQTVVGDTGVNGFTESFDGSASTTVWPGWTSTTTGGPSDHTWGVDGQGNAVWGIGTAGIQTIMRTWNTPATTSKVVGTIVLNNWITDANPPAEYLLIRSNTAGTTCVRLEIRPTAIILQAVVGGTVTQLGIWSNQWASGDTLVIYADDPATDRHYVVKRNGTTIIDATESGSISDTSQRKFGVGAHNGNNFWGLPIPCSLIKSVAGRES